MSNFHFLGPWVREGKPTFFRFQGWCLGHSQLQKLASNTFSQCHLQPFWWLITMMRNVKLPFFEGPWAEGREANIFQLTRLMLGIFTAPTISITHFLDNATCKIFVDLSRWWGMPKFHFLGPWAEGREPNFFQVPRLMFGTFTASKNSDHKKMTSIPNLK